MNRKTWLIIALALPIVALAASAYLKSLQRESGTQVVLPIEGFDPRDLLSGHYLTYRVDYGLGENGCGDYQGQANVCLRPQPRIAPEGGLAADCTLFIRGYCDSGRFSAGIERFYIPEEYAHDLEQAVRDKRGELVLSVGHSGTAAIRDLLIDNKPWKTAIGQPQ
jgi:uncharacterized membrane-anchored protein